MIQKETLEQHPVEALHIIITGNTFVHLYVSTCRDPEL